jgi:hypothetical protein
MHEDQWWVGDISDRYSFVEDRLIYYDAPLAGYLLCRECASTFVFHCQQQGQMREWLWRLVPVPATVRKEEDEDLLTIDLDRLAGEQHCSVIEIVESHSAEGTTLRGSRHGT